MPNIVVKIGKYRFLPRQIMPCVVILTALPLEYLAVRAHLIDNLISASDNDVDEITKEDSEAVLRAIASGSRIQDNCDRNTINVTTSISVDMVLNDLCKREVIDRKQETLFQIRVKLFKEWLLAN